MPLFFAAETNSKAIQYFRSVSPLTVYGIKQNPSRIAKKYFYSHSKSKFFCLANLKAIPLHTITKRKERTIMYKKIKKNPTKIIVVPHYVGTEKDTKVFKKIIEDKVQKKIKETA
jgi:hypothetical protein